MISKWKWIALYINMDNMNILDSYTNTASSYFLAPYLKFFVINTLEIDH